eukprot:scaffold380482_cov23-Prasinocladus_malaysianus.AAC.1
MFARGQAGSTCGSENSQPSMSGSYHLSDSRNGRPQHPLPQGLPRIMKPSGGDHGVGDSSS